YTTSVLYTAFIVFIFSFFFFFFSSRRRHTRFDCDWSSDVCSSDLCRKARSSSSSVLLEFRSEEELDRALRQGAVEQKVSDRIGRSEERRVGKECRSRWGA